MLKIGWFSTGRDEAARQLLIAVQDRIHSGDIEGEISFVFSNREPGEGKASDLFFELVRSYDIPLICLSHRSFRTPTPATPREGPAAEPRAAEPSQEDWRIRYDREVKKKIERFGPDICVLAGYMLIVGEELCRQYNMINLHPAPPGGPVGTFQEVMRQLIEDRATTAGAMMHLVTPELDRGPVVTYCLFAIDGEPFAQHRREGDSDTLFRFIREHELAREFPLIILTVRALSRGEVRIQSGRVLDSRERPINGYDLSAAVDRALGGEKT